MSTLAFGHYTYIVYLLAWASVVIALQWLSGWPELLARWRGLALATLLATAYLAGADRFALGTGIWEINPERSLGTKLLGLPLEEALFFLLTNLMVAQSVALLLAPGLSPRLVWSRLTEHVRALRRGLAAVGRSWRAGLAAASLAALVGTAAAGLLGAPPALGAPWTAVMELTPVPAAAWLVNVLGEGSRPLGLLGGFALYLLPGGLVGALARSGRVGLGLALALAAGLCAWLAGESALLPASILALGPLGSRLSLPAEASGATHTGPRLGRRDILVRLAPLCAALGLGVLWLGERRLRNQAASGASQPLFEAESVSPRSAGFPVPGQPPEVTPVGSFYVVSKNVEDPAPLIDAWRLRVVGQVERPLAVDFATLAGLPRVDQYTTLRCVSNPVGWPLMSNGLWSGVPLADLVGRAGVLPSTTRAVCRGLDGHYEDLPLAVVLAPDTLVAYALNGRYLDRRHGFPTRLVVPGRYGFKNVKWLSSVEVVGGDSPGYWPSRGWTRDGVMATAARIDLVRREGGQVLVAGVALAGTRGISAIQVRAARGGEVSEWQPASLHIPPLGRAAWVQWLVFVRLPDGLAARVEARAIDGSGQPQVETLSGPYPDGATGLHSVEVPS